MEIYKIWKFVINHNYRDQDDEYHRFKGFPNRFVDNTQSVKEYRY